MSITYFQRSDGSDVVITNSFLDFNGDPQLADNFFIDDLGVNIQIFFDNNYPSSLLTGSPRRFKSGQYPRVFKSRGYKRIFKS